MTQTGHPAPGNWMWRCPECRSFEGKVVVGDWGPWLLLEHVCPEGHYSAYDLATEQKILGLGYRLDRATGLQKQYKDGTRVIGDDGRWYKVDGSHADHSGHHLTFLTEVEPDPADRGETP